MSVASRVDTERPAASVQQDCVSCSALLIGADPSPLRCDRFQWVLDMAWIRQGCPSWTSAPDLAGRCAR